MIWPDPPINPPIHPPTHQTINPPMGGNFSIDFKSLNGIEISWLVQVLLNFYWFLGSPLGGGQWVDWDKSGYGCVGDVPCMHTCAHIHMHAHMHMNVKHDKHDKHGCLHIDGHLQFLYMYTCVCIHVHVCACMWGHPHAPRCSQIPLPTCPLPKATGSPKHQKSISPELIEIIRFCLKILYLWTLLNSYRL